MEKPQTWFASCMFKKHIEPSSYRCVFLLVYLLLLKIIASAIIKAIAMIVTIKSEKNNMYIVVIKYNVSIISLTSFWEANHIC